MSLVCIWTGINLSPPFIQTLTLKPSYNRHLIPLPLAAAINFNHLAPPSVHRWLLLSAISKTDGKPGRCHISWRPEEKSRCHGCRCCNSRSHLFLCSSVAHPDPRSFAAVDPSGCLLLCSGCRLPPEMVEMGACFTIKVVFVCVCCCFTMKCAWV